MVLVSILGHQSKQIVRENPITIGETIPFEINGHKFQLTLSRLDNRLFGDDSAVVLIEKGDVSIDETAVTSEYGESIITNVSGKLTFYRRAKGGRIEMRSREQDFSMQPGDWCWLTHDEILKIVSASETTVVYRLYQPAPFPRPF
jgi:hypothetical protein